MSEITKEDVEDFSENNLGFETIEEYIQAREDFEAMTEAAEYEEEEI